MSRVGNKPIVIPEGVKVNFEDSGVTVTGPKGELKSIFCSDIVVERSGNEIKLNRPNDLPKMRAQHGTSRANLANMIKGVTEGFSKTLDLVGVGYRAAASGKGLTLSLGYSHPIEVSEISGVTFKLEGNTKITIEGIDKRLVGQVAADIREKRPPEPYKGKGVKYSDEIIRRKVGKKA